jgi:DNA-binding response OmpR family regulator
MIARTPAMIMASRSAAIEAATTRQARRLVVCSSLPAETPVAGLAVTEFALDAKAASTERLVHPLCSVIMRILIVEDETNLAAVIQRGLEGQGYQAPIAESGEDAELFVRTEPVDLVLLDIGLPDRDGHEVLAELRRLRRDLPVIMVTARDDMSSKIGALDQGADDYITKPFNFDELLARIRALTRRADQAQAAMIAWQGLRIDLLSHRLWRDDQEVSLSRREFALLEYFARNPGRLLSRQQILAAVWEYDFDGESNVVDVYVRYLRNKLDRPDEPSLFTTIRGSGYRFDPPTPD